MRMRGEYVKGELVRIILCHEHHEVGSAMSSILKSQIVCQQDREGISFR